MGQQGAPHGSWRTPPPPQCLGFCDIHLVEPGWDADWGLLSGVDAPIHDGRRTKASVGLSSDPFFQPLQLGQCNETARGAHGVRLANSLLPSPCARRRGVYLCLYYHACVSTTQSLSGHTLKPYSGLYYYYIGTRGELSVKADSVPGADHITRNVARKPHVCPRSHGSLELRRRRRDPAVRILEGTGL